jgi:hypothetical protein
MPVVDNTSIRCFSLPGLDHQTVAGPEHGMQALEMWMQTISPGFGTPVHRHECEEAIVVIRGSPSRDRIQTSARIPHCRYRAMSFTRSLTPAARICS